MYKLGDIVSILVNFLVAFFTLDLWVNMENLSFKFFLIALSHNYIILLTVLQFNNIMIDFGLNDIIDLKA
jgi:hypothetical protein